MRIAAYVVLGSLLLTSVPAQDKIRTIHVCVALCDNEHQGIVPVPKTLGDGHDPANNLYWAARSRRPSGISSMRQRGRTRRRCPVEPIRLAFTARRTSSSMSGTTA